MDLEIKKTQDALSWIYDERTITIELSSLDNYLLFEKEKVILVLHDLEKNHPSRLSGYEMNGKCKFSIDPPKDFLFSYLTLHPEAGVTVVCSSNEKIEGWYDWHFAINPVKGKLRRWCPAM